MKTVYLQADDLEIIRDDLSINGYLLEQQGPDGNYELRAKPGVTYVEVGKIEASPAVYNDQQELVSPTLYQPGEFANITFISDTEANDFPLFFAPIHGTIIKPTPNNPVSILLSGGQDPEQVAAGQATYVVPASWVSRRAFFLALFEVIQISPEHIRTVLANNTVALIELEAPYFNPANPLFASLATVFGVSQEQLDLTWAKARRL